jgi:hypothetical protein
MQACGCISLRLLIICMNLCRFYETDFKQAIEKVGLCWYGHISIYVLVIGFCMQRRCTDLCMRVQSRMYVFLYKYVTQTYACEAYIYIYIIIISNIGLLVCVCALIYIVQASHPECWLCSCGYILV